MTKYVAGLSFASEEQAKVFYDKVIECTQKNAVDVVDVRIFIFFVIFADLIDYGIRKTWIPKKKHSKWLVTLDGEQ